MRVLAGFRSEGGTFHLLGLIQFEELAKRSAAERDSPIVLEVQRVLPLLSSQRMAAHASHGKKLDEVVAALTDLEMLAVKSDQRDVRTQQILAGLVDGLSRPFLIPGPATTNDGAAATSTANQQSSNAVVPPTESNDNSRVGFLLCRGSSGDLAILDISHISTVRELWSEYTIGLGALPSVKTMYEGDSTSWKQNDSERRFHRRRKVILNVIEKAAETRGRASVS
ncbi:MAG: hypothetical protein TREMPRED_002705 [Tremellales sp. Tagirdzhanova-0007]|nr:MAG: hypothetical protein TREMPRED_002705 [Tremellales sp. Tagirdzhanova-0007]